MTNGENALKDFLLQIDTELAKQLLADLRNENLRGPQLYAAIDKYLNRHKFQINSIVPDEEVNSELSDALANYKTKAANDRDEEREYA